MRASVTLATADSPGSVRTMCATRGLPVSRSSSVRSSSATPVRGRVDGVIDGWSTRPSL